MEDMNILKAGQQSIKLAEQVSSFPFLTFELVLWFHCLLAVIAYLEGHSDRYQECNLCDCGSRP
jgi:hypothetical protein